MFKAHLLRTVACAVRLIEFNKHCFVLVGKQNDGKTYLIRHLIPDELKPYYKENPPLDHKDSVIALSQNLIINIDELADLNKADANKVKSLFSQADTKIRGHYATKDAMQVRYASFFGTTNETEFLNDATGNVRWIPFTIENINHDRGGKNGYSKNVSIDDVWSQVYALVLSGEYGILRNDELSQMERQNFDYHKTTPEIDLISQLIEPSTSDDLAALAVTNTDLLQALYLYTNKTIRFTPQGLGKALTFLKHVRASARIGSKNSAVKCYYVRTKDIHFGHLLTKEPTTSTTSLQLSNN
jgi:predicted P-loop ATPase